MLDLRVLVTTNATELVLDDAVVRKGRLCRRMAVGRFSAAQAGRVLRRLLPEHRSTGRTFRGPTTLTDVYGRARALGWKPTTEAPPMPEAVPQLVKGKRGR